MSAALVEDTSSSLYDATSKTWTATVTAKQTQDKWSGEDSVNIGGVDVAPSTKSWTLTYNTSTKIVDFEAK